MNEQKEDSEFDKLFENVMNARSLIVKDSEGKRNRAEKVDCPVCSAGKLEYYVAFNGHIHATCTTEHCLNWLE